MVENPFNSGRAKMKPRIVNWPTTLAAILIYSVMAISVVTLIF